MTAAPKSPPPKPPQPKPERFTRTIKLTPLAKLLGITERQVNKLAKDGVIPRSGRGKYDEFTAVPAYIDHVREGKSAAKRDALYEQDILLRRTQIKKNELEIARLSGQTVPIDQALIIWERVIVAVKTNIEMLENEVPRIREAKSSVDAKELMKKAIHHALADLSQANIDIPAPRADEGGEGDDAPLAAAAGPDDQRVGRNRDVAQPRRQQRSRKVSH